MHTEVPAIAEWRFVTGPCVDHPRHATRYSTRSIALMLEHIRVAVHANVHQPPFLTAFFIDPSAAPLVKAAQIAAHTRRKTDALIEHLQYLDLLPPAADSPALAAFAVELFRRFKYSLVRAFMSVEAVNHYEDMCGTLNAIVMNSTPCDARGEIRREPPV